jgi:glyoxylase I family protein
MRNVIERSLSSAGKTNGNNMLKHICPLLQVNDLRASLVFYGEKLGFQTGSADEEFSIVRRDDCTLHLAQRTKVADVTNRAARAAPDDGWCNYDIQFYCQPGTLDALFEEFRSKGVRMPDCYKQGPVKRSYGIRDFSVIDPDGYDLVFGEEGPEGE